jgi:hypothetical protein
VRKTDIDQPVLWKDQLYLTDSHDVSCYAGPTMELWRAGSDRHQSGKIRLSWTGGRHD